MNITSLPVSEEQAMTAFRILEDFIKKPERSKYSEETCSEALKLWHNWKKQSHSPQALFSSHTDAVARLDAAIFASVHKEHENDTKSQ